MRSPFPGMDPYIEACQLWEDFHLHLIAAIKDSLARTAPERYLIRTGKRSYLVLVEEGDKFCHPVGPDVIATTPESRKQSRMDAAGDSWLTMRAFIEEEHREAFVEIYEAAPEQRLVTCIEVLSPSNKRPGTPGWDLYVRKRQSLMLGRVNLVEIDLLRGGRRMPMLDPWPDCPYTLLVARAGKPYACRVRPAHFRQRLPSVRVPLAKPDPDIPLDLQPMIESIYQRSRYGRSIDYAKPLPQPLAPADLAWLAERLTVRKEER